MTATETRPESIDECIVRSWNALRLYAKRNAPALGTIMDGLLNDNGLDRILKPTTLAETTKTTMRVRIINNHFKLRESGHTEKLRPFVQYIVISRFCPQCGAKRGWPKPFEWLQDRQRLVIDKWSNKCGHPDNNFYALWLEAGKP